MPFVHSLQRAFDVFKRLNEMFVQLLLRLKQLDPCVSKKTVKFPTKVSKNISGKAEMNPQKQFAGYKVLKLKSRMILIAIKEC